MFQTFSRTFQALALFTVAVLSPLLGWGAGLSLVCQPSRAPLFSNTNINAPLNVTVMVDYQRLNQKKNDGEIPAVIAWFDGGAPHFLPLLLKQRGQIRREACAEVPYKMTFLKSAVAAQLEVETGRTGARFGSVLYMKRYYEGLSKKRLTIDIDGGAQQSGLFSGLGKSLKVVTHCGVSDRSKIYGNEGGWLMQNRRVLAEYYIYQILGLFQPVVEDTRLVEVKYLNPAGRPVHTASVRPGKVLHTNFAIYREPDKKLAERCGLLHDPTPEMLKRKNLQVDTNAYFEFSFYNSFVANMDFTLQNNHNIQMFFRPNSNVVYSPYDFDISGLASVEYDSLTKDVFREFSKNAKPLAIYAPIRRETYARAVQLRPQIRSLIQSSIMSPEQKLRFQNWFNEAYRLMGAAR